MTLVHVSAECGCIHSSVDVGVIENDEWCLAAKLQQNRLELLGRKLSDDLADAA
ncbi:hypothetical protein ABID16_004607 [Rhizobium aquaticum]|uniref:Transposase n=1 Tax=Rhizobium aquaticum TaxID=1549636 RepID=A0ABV2J657_9HYPH